jgi:hypothetical protein
MSAPHLHAPFAEQLELFGGVGSPGFYLPTPEEIEAAKTPFGGWTRKTLAQWGVEWPPRRGWKQRLIAMGRARAA